MPTAIRNLFAKPIDRHIEGVIKADDESDLITEVSEYVVTTEVASRLDDLLAAYLGGSASNGVWISGFFGSGKSHLLKMLSLLLENRAVDSTTVPALFLPKLSDAILKGDLERAIKIPSRSVRFNIDQKADLIAKDQTDALLAVFVKVFNELRGYYPKQGYIAEIEADLDSRGLLKPFKDTYRSEAKGRTWEEDRDVVHTLENETFARAYSKVTGMTYNEALLALDRKQAAYKVSIESFAEAISAWLARQPSGLRLNFFVDEVGQFIGTNSKLMLNLQTLAETLATRCKGQAWLFVTSQGDLATVLGELTQSQGNDFTKIQGRFKTLLNLTSQDVSEVICARLLAKTPPQPPDLVSLYAAEKNTIKTLFQFGDGSRTYRGFEDQEAFCDYYPFHPYQFDLLGASLIGLSKHNFFTGKHRAVGERSMLAILQDVAKAIAAQPVGRFATFEAIFDGLRGALRGDLQTAVQVAEKNLGGARSLPVRLLKSLFLVKFVKEFKSTPRNLAILLIDRCDLNIEAHEQAVRQALSQLENETYIQRNGEIYEFLTDDEKDVETEIKDTDIDETEISELLGQIVFDDIIQDTKLRFEDNKQDYPFTRRLDGQVFRKREYDLAIHLASPLYESFYEPAALAAQTMGKAELLVVLPDDAKVLTDLKLYLQTEKYVRQNLSPALPSSRRNILTAKAQNNQDRLNSLEQWLREGLCVARLILNGSPLEINSADPRTRITKGFHELVRYAYPALRMLRRTFTEVDLRETLSKPADEFFRTDDGTLGEAEQEILLKLRSFQLAGERRTVADLLALFEKRPYGWPQIALLCLLARLFMRGKIELRKNGSLLDADEILAVLSSNRNFQSTVVTLQEQFDAASIARLKNFHRDLFNTANAGADAKETAEQFQNAVRAEAAELEKLVSHAAAYPFLARLTPVAVELRSISDREWAYCLKNLPDFSERLLDAKETTIDPLKQFFAGPKRKIYEDIRTCLHDDAPNFADIAGAEVQDLRATIESDTPYKGNTLQQAKQQLDALREKIAAMLTSARKEAMARVQQAIGRVKGSLQFKSLPANDQAAILAPFETSLSQIERERLAPVIRQIADRTLNDILPNQLQRVAQLAASKEGNGSKAAQYISARLIPVTFDKAIIESEADLDAYLAALKAAYLAELKKNKRITL